MTPIINPWIFYWMSVLDTLKILGIIVTLLGGIGYIIYLLICTMDSSLKYKFIVVGGGILLAFSILSAIFIPSKDLMLKMLVAQNVTYERIEITADVVQDVYEDIMDLFGEKES